MGRDERRSQFFRTPCECLDFMQTAHRDRVYPLMYCRITTKGHVDVQRLRDAVQLSAGIVPEILCIYDFKHHCFRNVGFEAGQAVTVKDRKVCDGLIWDLGTDTQLKVLVSANGEGDDIVVGMSHVLSDGNGFIQYLYLLADLYNGRERKEKNCRSIKDMLKDVRISPVTEQAKDNRCVAVLPLLPGKSRGERLYCETEKISGSEWDEVCDKAKKSKVALNIVFMTAYARVIGRLTGQEKVALSCPADLRRFFEGVEKLTVANMTGLYRQIIFEVAHRFSFDETMAQANVEMMLQKKRKRCFAGIFLLNKTFSRIPAGMVSLGIKRIYRLNPVSYTNFGKINEKNMHFDGIEISECYFTGTYRRVPDFQLTVSTFRGQCSLNCMLIGDEVSRGAAGEILKEVKREIVAWSRIAAMNEI